MSAGEERVIVRRLQPHESGVYRAVRLDCLWQHRDVSGTTPEEEEFKPVLHFERAILEQDPFQVMLGAFVDGRLSGLCGFARETRIKTRHRAELVQMYVAPHAVGRGVGGRLVAGVLSHAFGHTYITQVTRSVVADNAPAVRLYERHGFREYGRLPAYFRYRGQDQAQIFMLRERTSSD